MRSVPLGDVIDVDRAIASEDECRTMPYVGLEDIEKESGRFSDDFRPKPQQVLATKFHFTQDHVLYGKLRPYLNKVALPHFRGVCTTEILPLLPKPGKLERGFLYAALLSPRFVSWASQNVSGANLPRLGPDRLLEYEFWLPDLAEQKRIAAILERADRLRRVRRHAVEMGETILVAAFREFFGARFDKGPFLRLNDLVKITGGGTPSRERPEYFRGSIPWLTSKDMRGDYIWDTEEHITQEAIEDSCTNLVPVDSILLVVKSKVLMHRLPVAIAKVPLCHGQDIKSIQCSAKLHPEFARFVLKHHERRLLQIARGANTEGLTLPMLHELPVPKVDVGEQTDFAQLVQRTECVRSIHRESLRQAEHLFQTLLHRAFTSVDPNDPNEY